MKAAVKLRLNADERTWNAEKQKAFEARLSRHCGGEGGGKTVEVEVHEQGHGPKAVHANARRLGSVHDVTLKVKVPYACAEKLKDETLEQVGAALELQVLAMHVLGLNRGVWAADATPAPSTNRSSHPSPKPAALPDRFRSPPAP